MRGKTGVGVELSVGEVSGGPGVGECYRDFAGIFFVSLAAQSSQ